jgi:hypothetical protein
LEEFIGNLPGVEAITDELDQPKFGGELGQRRRALARLIDLIDLDCFVCRMLFNKNRKVSDESLDNLGFRTKAFAE